MSLKTFNDSLGIGPPRDVFRVDKRGNLDVLKTTLRESIN
jgi:hypothetical protein